MSDSNNNAYFAVIDTETTWSNEVMSIGIVISNSADFLPLETKYYVLSPEYLNGGMFSSVIKIKGQKVDINGSRSKIISDIKSFFEKYNIFSIYAYNANFDYKLLPELNDYAWFDIMKIAAYKQHNKAIPSSAECHGTGRLKREYGVEPMMRLLSKSKTYRETHNALCDAIDELKLMNLLSHPIDYYDFSIVNPDCQYYSSKYNNQSKSRKTNKTIRKIIKIEDKTKYNSYYKTYVCEHLIGDVINHKMFGRGIILDICKEKEGFYHAQIDFILFGKINVFLPQDEKFISVLSTGKDSV